MPKAILIKYLPGTATQAPRLKATTEAGNLIESVNDEMDLADQALRLARQYVRDRNWSTVTGFGQLPNGDFVATIGGV